jgi:hypothetical protein
VCADQIDEPSPGDLGDETALVGRHPPIQYFLRELLRVFGRFADVTGFERWPGSYSMVDIVLVPGGSTTPGQMVDDEVLDWLRKVHETIQCSYTRVKKDRDSKRPPVIHAAPRF